MFQIQLSCLKNAWKDLSHRLQAELQLTTYRNTRAQDKDAEGDAEAVDAMIILPLEKL